MTSSVSAHQRVRIKISTTRHKLANRLTLDSREVAEMVGKEHFNLLQDIKTYVGYLENTGELKSQVSDFFQPSTYISNQNKELPNYQITKKGCEFIAHKLTGQKGALFTATYINKFHEMEQALLIPAKPKHLSDTKAKEIEARLKNANSRQATLLLKIADSIKVDEYKQVLQSYATKIITGQRLLPLPEAGEKTYTAAEIGEMLGISANKVGRLANANNLKTSEFGKVFYDKARHANKQVETFRYYDKVVPIIKGLIN